MTTFMTALTGPVAIFVYLSHFRFMKKGWLKKINRKTRKPKPKATYKGGNANHTYKK